MCTSKLPEKALSLMGTKGRISHEVVQSLHLCRVYSLFLAKTRMLSLSFSLLCSSGSLKSSSNTPHITLSEFAVEDNEPKQESQVR